MHVDGRAGRRRADQWTLVVGPTVAESCIRSAVDEPEPDDPEPEEPDPEPEPEPEPGPDEPEPEDPEPDESGARTGAGPGRARVRGPIRTATSSEPRARSGAGAPEPESSRAGAGVAPTGRTSRSSRAGLAAARPPAVVVDGRCGRERGRRSSRWSTSVDVVDVDASTCVDVVGGRGRRPGRARRAAGRATPSPLSLVAVEQLPQAEHAADDGDRGEGPPAPAGGRAGPPAHRPIRWRGAEDRADRHGRAGVRRGVSARVGQPQPPTGGRRRRPVLDPGRLTPLSLPAWPRPHLPDGRTTIGLRTDVQWRAAPDREDRRGNDERSAGPATEGGDVRAVVTGCAGFIGSHVCERLVADGWHVRGVDAFTPYYDAAEKEANLAGLAGERRFTLVRGDLATMPLRPLLGDADVVVHLAAQPGVRASFGAGFARCDRDNVLATQRVLEAALDAGVPPRRDGLVVVGVRRRRQLPVPGDGAAAPAVAVRGDEAGVRGPRRRLPAARPRRRRAALLHGVRPAPATRHGRAPAVRGARRRAAVRALRRRRTTSATSPTSTTPSTRPCGRRRRPTRAPVLNVGGGEQASMDEVIDLLGELAGAPVPVRAGADAARRRRAHRRRHDCGPPRSAGRRRSSLADGLRSELSWVRDRAARPLPSPGGRRDGPRRRDPPRVVVVGQGYVGLPLAMRAVEVGHDVDRPRRRRGPRQAPRRRRLVRRGRRARRSWRPRWRPVATASRLDAGRLRRLRRRRHHRADADPRRRARPLVHRGGRRRASRRSCAPAASSCWSRRRTRARPTSCSCRSSSAVRA